MKVQELRIGNWVKINKLPEQIKISFFDQWENDFDGFTNAIPLTEEWLLKFGLERCTHRRKDDSLKISLGDKYRFIIRDNDGMTIEDGGMNYIWMETPKHVHQLQNLFYALTGEELIIKETETA